MLHHPVITDTERRPTQIEIDLSAITFNYRRLRQLAAPAKMMCILKANAYGHGLLRIGAHLESLGAEYFGVAYLEEGIMLREAGIKTPILVMGGIIGDQIPLFIQYKLTITASSVDKLRLIDQTAARMASVATVHLKIDTGMERIGIHYYSAGALIEESRKCMHTRIEGIFSHLANADDPQSSYTALQFQRMDSVLSYYKNSHDVPELVHMANSAALIAYPTARYSMVRVGLMLYGVSPSEHLVSPDVVMLRPALSWKTRIVYFKVIRANHPVSYGSTWSSATETRIITLPVGYGDGYFRSMSHRAQVVLRDRRYPVVGMICMDQMMVNIGWDSGYNGEEVYLIGGSADEKISVAELALWAGTIPYEILTNINTRVPRIYKESTSAL